MTNHNFDLNHTLERHCANCKFYSYKTRLCSCTTAVMFNCTITDSSYACRQFIVYDHTSLPDIIGVFRPSRRLLLLPSAERL